MATEIAVLTIRPGLDPDDESSDAFKTRQSLLTTLSKQPGYIRSNWGRELEDKQTLRMYIDWESVEAHKKFMDAEAYGPFKQQLASIFDHTKILLYHVHLDPYPGIEFRQKSTSPATEALTLYFPEDYSEADRQVAQDQLRKLVDIMEKESSHCHGGSGGWAVEKLPIPGSDVKGTVFAGVVAWSSIEGHMSFREAPVFKENIGLLRGLKDLKGVEMVHVALEDGPAAA